MFGGSDLLELLLARLDAEIAAADAFIAEHLNGREQGDRDLVRALIHRCEVRVIVGRSEEACHDLARVEAILKGALDQSSDITLPAMFTPQLVAEYLCQVPDPDAVPAEVWAENSPLLRLARFDPRFRRDPGTPMMVAVAALELLVGGHPDRGIRELRWVCRRQEARHGRDDPVALFARTTLAHGYFALAQGPADYVGGERKRSSLLEQARSELFAVSADHLRLFGPGHPYTVHVHKLLCSLLAWSADDELALRTTVIALVLADLGRHRLADTRNRSGWREEYGQLLALAVRLASTQQAHAILVEAIELGRSQGLPAAIPAVGSSPTARDGVALADATEKSGDGLKVNIPVLSGGRIAVGGVSHLAAIDAVSEAFMDRASGLAPGPSDVIELMAWATDVCGHDAPWVWGWWDIDGEHVSYVARYGADGDDVEVLHDAAWRRSNGAESSALSSYAAAMQQDNESLRDFVARSDLTRSIRSERELFTRLGHEIVPPPIQAEVLRRIASGEPALRLVVLPSPECSRVPFAALAVGDPRQPTTTVPTVDSSTDPRRLVEGARLYLPPGVQFTATVRRRYGDRWEPPDAEHNVRAVVASQPGLPNFLPWAGASVPPDAEHLADGAGASLSRVVQQLAGIAAGSAGVLQFSGHAVAGSPEEPGAAHLLLHGGQGDPRERLYAGDLLTGRFPRIGLPRCVVLAACSTWGDQGAADWLGLAPGLMWNGAQHVVATLWPILDARETAAYHRDLVGRLAAGDGASPIDAIRQLQLAELHRQRTAAPLHPRYQITPEDLDGVASGFLWAAYTVLTAGSSLA